MDVKPLMILHLHHFTWLGTCRNKILPRLANYYVIQKKNIYLVINLKEWGIFVGILFLINQV